MPQCKSHNRDWVTKDSLEKIKKRREIKEEIKKGKAKILINLPRYCSKVDFVGTLFIKVLDI